MSYDHIPWVKCNYGKLPISAINSSIIQVKGNNGSLYTGVGKEAEEIFDDYPIAYRIIKE